MSELSTDRMTYVPYMGDHALLMPAVLGALGFPAETLPPPDEETLAIGREFCLGRECLPLFVFPPRPINVLSVQTDCRRRFNWSCTARSFLICAGRRSGTLRSGYAVCFSATECRNPLRANSGKQRQNILQIHLLLCAHRHRKKTQLKALLRVCMNPL